MINNVTINNNNIYKDKTIFIIKMTESSYRQSPVV